MRRWQLEDKAAQKMRLRQEEAKEQQEKQREQEKKQHYPPLESLLPNTGKSRPGSIHFVDNAR